MTRPTPVGIGVSGPLSALREAGEVAGGMTPAALAMP